MNRQTILVVEDDPKVRTLLRNVFEDEGYAVQEAETIAQVLDILHRITITLITLDIRLGQDNGIEVARAVRQVSTVPIIMVTGKDDVIDRVVGLEVGADDYITKPFHIREVLARIRTVLRRVDAPSRCAAPVAQIAADASTQVRFDGLIAVPDRLQLLDRAGHDCGLTSGDYRLLMVFLDRPKRVLSRDQLMDLTGGVEWSPLDRTIDNQIARLRKKIERDPSDPKLIKTIRGVGYTFASDVQNMVPDQSGIKSA